MVNITLASSRTDRFKDLSDVISAPQQEPVTEITEYEIRSIYKKLNVDQKQPFGLVLLNLFRYVRGKKLIVLGSGNFLRQIRLLEAFGVDSDKIGLVRWTSIGGFLTRFENGHWQYGLDHGISIYYSEGDGFKLLWRKEKRTEYNSTVPYHEKIKPIHLIELGDEPYPSFIEKETIF